MRIWRPQPEEADFAAICLIPWLIPTESIDVMVEKLRTRLRGRLSFCAIALDNDVIQAVLIAYITDGHVWLWQAHARKGFKYSRTMMDGLKHWTRFKGLREIRMGTDKKKRAFQRRWGFIPDGDEMRLQI